MEARQTEAPLLFWSAVIFIIKIIGDSIGGIIEFFE
jgi:hypothetical protein